MKNKKDYYVNSVEKKICSRYAFTQLIINILFWILIAYLFGLQVFDLSGYKERGIAIRTTNSLTLRGKILDRNGITLANDELTYEVYAHPSLYTEKCSPEIIACTLYPYLQVSEEELLKKLKSKKFNIITLKKNVEKSAAKKIQNQNLRAISVGTINKRLYPQKNLASHVIGYYSHLSKNAIGIENIANQKLQNIRNLKGVQKTAQGSVIFDFDTDMQNLTEKKRGEDVTLTIDASVQYVCEKELEKTIKEKKAKRGAIIVMDPTNGEILAYASSPTFDPNKYWDFSQQEMKNWSLTDIYPPGSTFKIITVATALELGVINENTKINDTGKMTIDKFVIKNHDFEKHPDPGDISLDYLFEHSSNVASAKIALMIDPETYYQKLRDFGFGEKTGIDLTAESNGLLPSFQNWYKSRQASMGYGYGASVTAIQMLAAVSAIANNGTWITPHVIKYSDKEKDLYVKQKRVISEQNAKSVTKLLAKGISNGNTVLNLEKYTVAAKTGTSRKHVSSGKDVYTSAIGYFPSTNPKVAIYVIVDSPQTGNDFGGTIASPVFAKIATEIAPLLNIQSDKR